MKREKQTNLFVQRVPQRSQDGFNGAAVQPVALQGGSKVLLVQVAAELDDLLGVGCRRDLVCFQSQASWMDQVQWVGPWQAARALNGP